MDFNYSDTQRMLHDSAEKVIKASANIEGWRAQRAVPDGLDPTRWSSFVDLGWLALPIPEDAGGLGGTLEDVVVLMTALGAGLAVEPYVSTAVLGAHLIAKAAQGERRRKLLEQIAAGELRLALAHAEAGDRYELDSPRATTAHRQDDGYILSGVKTLALDAPSATHVIVTASLDGAGTALFLVDRSIEGVTATAYPLIDGARAADIVLTDVRLPGDALLAQGAAATSLLGEAVDRATVALIAQALGSMEACLDICSAYMKERKQFGQPIGNFQVLQHLIVDMLVAAHQARSIIYQALASIEAEPDVRARAVSAAKIVAGEAMQLVSRTGIQLHGGYGLTDEYAISHHYRRLMTLEKTYGDVDFHTRRLARLSLGEAA